MLTLSRALKTYELREHGAVVYASSSQEASIAQVDQSLDVEDKAWRTLRRESDMVGPFARIGIDAHHVPLE